MSGNFTLTIVRAEREGDYSAIANVVRQAFGQDDEVGLVARLRDRVDYDPALSLVAEQGGKIVGHILFTSIEIHGPDRIVPSLALAPMSVLPSVQGMGIGTDLVRQGLYICKQRDHGSVIVVGHSDYYRRFGFAPASRYGITAGFEVPDEAFMAIELAAGSLDGVSGVVYYPPEFEGV